MNTDYTKLKNKKGKRIQTIMEDALKQHIAHEDAIDKTILPEDWTFVEQRAFVKGMKHALEIIKNPEPYLI